MVFFLTSLYLNNPLDLYLLTRGYLENVSEYFFMDFTNILVLTIFYVGNTFIAAGWVYPRESKATHTFHARTRDQS